MFYSSLLLTCSLTRSTYFSVKWPESPCEGKQHNFFFLLRLIEALSEQRNCVVCYTAGVGATEIFMQQHKRKWPQACQQEKVKGIKLKTKISILTYLEPHQLRKAVTELAENKPKQQRKRKYIDSIKFHGTLFSFFVTITTQHLFLFLQTASYLQENNSKHRAKKRQ